MTKTSKKSTASKEAVDSKQKMKLVATNSLAGKYFMPYSEGQEFEIDGKRGQELIDNKDAESVK